jgi:hypothetical protein
MARAGAPRLPCAVAAGILPAVEPGILPGGTGLVRTVVTVHNWSIAPGGKMPPSTAGRMPAATRIER